MRKGFNWLLMVCAAWVAVSCSDTKSYTDMLNDEEDAIDRLIAQEGIEVLKHLPEDSVFDENQFVKLDDDILLKDSYQSLNQSQEMGNFEHMPSRNHMF